MVGAVSYVSNFLRLTSFHGCESASFVLEGSAVSGASFGVEDIVMTFANDGVFGDHGNGTAGLDDLIG